MKPEEIEHVLDQLQNNSNQLLFMIKLIDAKVNWLITKDNQQESVIRHLATTIGVLPNLTPVGNVKVTHYNCEN